MTVRVRDVGSGPPWRATLHPDFPDVSHDRLHEAGSELFTTWDAGYGERLDVATMITPFGGADHEGP